MTLKTSLQAAAVALIATGAHAAPVSLNGLGLEKTWVDTEAGADEMPDFVWGDASFNNANEIGLYVAFDDGTTGSITWTGVSPYWNTSPNNFLDMNVTSHSGFFSLYANAEVHFLYNTAATTSFPEALPIAWSNNPGTPFGGNVELDYNEQNGSQFRASVTGWGSAEWATYSSTASVAPIPLPATLPALAFAVGWLFLLRRRSA